MLEAAELYEALVAFFQPKRLAGKRVLLTAGPTYEPPRPGARPDEYFVRQDGLRPRARLRRGRRGSDAGFRPGLPAHAGGCASDRCSECLTDEALGQMPTDIFIAVAAVADYRPAAPAEHKIKKAANTLNLELAANLDILAEVAGRADAPFCVGFAAESRDLPPMPRYRVDKGTPHRCDIWATRDEPQLLPGG